MAHDRFCDYRPAHLIGVDCICDFIEEVRKSYRQWLAQRIGVEVLHQRNEGISTCLGCGRNPCELDGEQ